jgi:hypothetical protein
MKLALGAVTAPTTNGQKFCEFVTLRTPSSTSILPPLYRVPKFGLASDSRAFGLNLRGGEPTNNPRLNQRRGNPWVQNQISGGCRDEEASKKQRNEAFALDGDFEGGAETSIPSMLTSESEDSARPNESEDDSTRPPLPFDGATVVLSLVQTALKQYVVSLIHRDSLGPAESTAVLTAVPRTAHSRF